MKTIRGRVIKCNSNRFVVDILSQDFGDKSSKYITCNARKKIKQNNSEIVTGDFVELEKAGDEYVLNSILPRNNILVRPPVSNIDQLIIVVAPVPEMDFVLTDKLIINARSQGLKIVLCVNKSDILLTDLFDEINAQYCGIVDSIIYVSTISGDLTALMALLTGKLSCLAGQSAVGKSSLINAITGSARLVGEMSEKILRGKNTTTSVELIKLKNQTYIVDTPGFSMLDIHDITCDNLDLYYDEFLQASRDCRFSRCTHTVEPDCCVKQAVLNGEINKERYYRYCLILEELKKVKKY